MKSHLERELAWLATLAERPEHLWMSRYINHARERLLWQAARARLL